MHRGFRNKAFKLGEAGPGGVDKMGADHRIKWRIIREHGIGIGKRHSDQRP